MKLHCHRASLTSAFQAVSGVVPSRTPKEILKNVKLTFADGKATLIGTDQEIGIRYEVPGIEGESTGETLLLASRVLAILRELQNEFVDIDVTDEAVWIRSGQSEFKLASENAAEFPPVAGFDALAYHSVAGPVFKQMIRRTVFATDVESTRYALGGLLFELSEDSLTVAATDSRRLAVVRAKTQVTGSPEVEAESPVIPAKAMTVLERTIDGDEAEVRFAIHANDVVMQSGAITVYCRLVAGRFPRYRDVIPRESTVKIDMAVGPFYGAVRQAQIVTNEESRGVDFRFNTGTLTLVSRAAEIGESKVELPIGYEGDEITIRFDPRYVADFLRVLEPENTVELSLVDGDNAAVLRTDDNYEYVIMPLSRER